MHGNVRLSSGEVQAIVDGLRGSNILTADLPAYRRRLMESPWVADVALRRVLPSTIEVFVSERRPMGLCRLGSTLYLVDPRGTMIDEFGPQYAEFDLPIIDGLVGARRAPGRPSIDESRADLAARVIDALAARKDIAQRISQIDVRDAHDAVVLLAGRRGARCISARTSSSSACSRTSTSRRRCARACRTSTTWICGSTSACTCARRR